MITIERITTLVIGLDLQDLGRWIADDWVRPEGSPGHYRFAEIDVARVRLILELRDGMGLDESAIPVVLSLLDQLYETRRGMRQLQAAITATLPPELHQQVLDRVLHH